MNIVMGHGVNDCGYKVQLEERDSSGKRIVVWRCPYYQVWSGMLKRVYGKNSPAYRGCSVSEEWKSFSSFRKWMQNQPQHEEWLNQPFSYDLDKDFIVEGNRVYGEDFCLLIPRKINNIFAGLHKNKDGLPYGVNWKKSHNQYVAQINLDGKKKHLGLFDDPKEAHTKWLLYKWSFVNQILEDYEDSDYQDKRISERLQTFMLQLSTAIAEGSEFTRGH